MSPFTLTLIFLISLLLVVAILYWQSYRVKKGEVIIKTTRAINSEAPFRIRDILLIILYLIKHAVQFIIVQSSRLYFFLEKRIRNMTIHKNPRVAKVLEKLKIPPIPPYAKSFMRKTIEETKQKINRVKKDLAELEDTMDKRVD